MASADNGNGLTNMRKRAQTFGGKLSISSVEKEGTPVEMEVKLLLSHLYAVVLYKILK